MPRTELPSGNWVDWSDKWMSGTRFAVKAAVVYKTVIANGTAVQESDAANTERQLLALWEKQITAWSWSDQGIPVPSQNVAGAEVIWSVLDGPDFNALEEATSALLDEVTGSPTKKAAAGRPSSGS